MNAMLDAIHLSKYNFVGTVDYGKTYAGLHKLRIFFLIKGDNLY